MIGDRPHVVCEICGRDEVEVTPSVEEGLHDGLLFQTRTLIVLAETQKPSSRRREDLAARLEQFSGECDRSIAL